MQTLMASKDINNDFCLSGINILFSIWNFKTSRISKQVENVNLDGAQIGHLSVHNATYQDLCTKLF